MESESQASAPGPDRVSWSVPLRLVAARGARAGRWRAAGGTSESDSGPPAARLRVRATSANPVTIMTLLYAIMTVS